MRQRVIVAGLLLSAAGALHAHRSAQEVPSALFVPDLVLASSEALSLSSHQAASVASLAEGLADGLEAIHALVAAESAELLDLFEAVTVDEAAATRSIDRLLDLERQANRLRLLQVISVKNLLTAEQQAQLAEIRHQGAEGE